MLEYSKSRVRTNLRYQSLFDHSMQIFVDNSGYDARNASRKLWVHASRVQSMVMDVFYDFNLFNESTL